MIVRAMEPRDFGAVEECAREAFGAACRPSAAETRLAFAAEVDGAFAGFVIGHLGTFTWPCGSATAQLAVGSLAVVPRFRGQGVGRALMERFLTEAPRLGYESAVVTGEPAFFARFGFVPAARLGIFLLGHSPAEDLPRFLAKDFGGGRTWFGGFYNGPAESGTTA